MDTSFHLMGLDHRQFEPLFDLADARLGEIRLCGVVTARRRDGRPPRACPRATPALRHTSTVGTSFVNGAPPHEPDALRPPFSSYCQKVLIALYENATPHTLRLLGAPDGDAAREFAALWPIRRMPVLVDAGRTLMEASIIVEHLALHHAGPVRLIPADAARRWTCASWTASSTTT